MKLDWPTMDQVSIFFEIISYALVTPALYGKDRLDNLKKYLDKMFEKIRNYKNVDITTKIIEGKLKSFIEAFFLGIWIYLISLALFYGNNYIEYLIIFIFIFLPIIIILIGFFTKREKQMILLSVNILLFPSVKSTKLLKYSLLKLEKSIDSALEFIIGLMQNKENSVEYPLIIIGTLFFIASKFLILFKPFFSTLFAKVSSIF